MDICEYLVASQTPVSTWNISDVCDYSLSSWIPVSVKIIQQQSVRRQERANNPMTSCLKAALLLYSGYYYPPTMNRRAKITVGKS